MSRLDLSQYLLPIAPKLAGVEAELQHILQSDVEVVQKLADHVRGGQGKRLRPALVMLSSASVVLQNEDDVRFGAVFRTGPHGHPGA